MGEKNQLLTTYLFDITFTTFPHNLYTQVRDPHTLMNDSLHSRLLSEPLVFLSQGKSWDLGRDCKQVLPLNPIPEQKHTYLGLLLFIFKKRKIGGGFE